VCVHHFTPWNRCESAPLPTQSQPSTVVSPYSESSPILLSGAPASSNGPHPDRRPHNASDITLSYSAYAVSYAPVEASRGPHRFHPRGSPPLSRRRGRHFGNRPYLLERTPRVSSESPGDRTQTLIISWLFQSHMAKPARGKAATQCCESVLGRGPRTLPSPRGEKHTRLHPGSSAYECRVHSTHEEARLSLRWTLPRRHHLS